MRPSPRDALFSEASDSLTISLFYMFGFFYLFTSAQSANCRPFLHYILWDLFFFDTGDSLVFLPICIISLEDFYLRSYLLKVIVSWLIRTLECTSSHLK